MQAEGIPDFAALKPGYDRMPTRRGRRHTPLNQL
jgi:hypothetical protein